MSSGNQTFLPIEITYEVGKENLGNHWGKGSGDAGCSDALL
jgi:hypothetical protein